MNSPVPERTAFVPPHETSIAQQPALVKPFWTNLLGPSWVVALVIFAIVASVRFFVFLGPYSLQELLFLQIVGLWTLPFVLLTDRGRRQIGLTAAGTTAGPLLGGAVTGAVCGFLLFKLGTEIYGNSPNNWDLSIRSYLRFDEMRGLLSPAELFALYAFPAVFVNPAGEEILFRGLIQEAFSSRFNRAFSSAVSSVLFGMLYLYLHGIWHDGSGFHLRLGSAVLAIVLLSLIGFTFHLCRVLSGSLWAAMTAHAGFNLALLTAAILRFAH
ncbi:MAG TPA: type II CAAX endopeptidase family protein [Terracidiphilus sp.]|jgi:membrane protease YdiL (CAAX protease family)